MTTYELATEYPAPDEAEHYQRLIDVLMAQMRKDYPTGIMRRDAHPKQHGVVRAEFTVADDLPESLRVGVFSTPQTFPCWIRYSNSGGTGGIHPDSKRDVRGMAIKLVGVEGDKILPDEQDAVTQDFLLATHPVFIVRNGVDFAQLAAGLGGPDVLKLLAFFFNPFNLRLRELMLLIRSQQTCANLLGQQYWSMVPSLLGEGQAVKYTAIPRTTVNTNLPANPTDNFLRERLRAHLAEQEAVFDFCVQVQTNPYTMPVEDARIQWDEADSPFIKVATIRIPAQTFDSPEQEQFGEQMSYTPWHSLPEHRPLGGVNRARRVVYEAISRFRHEYNNAPRTEPDSVTPF